MHTGHSGKMFIALSDGGSPIQVGDVLDWHCNFAPGRVIIDRVEHAVPLHGPAYTEVSFTFHPAVDYHLPITTNELAALLPSLNPLGREGAQVDTEPLSTGSLRQLLGGAEGIAPPRFNGEGGFSDN